MVVYAPLMHTPHLTRLTAARASAIVTQRPAGGYRSRAELLKVKVRRMAWLRPACTDSLLLLLAA